MLVGQLGDLSRVIREQQQALRVLEERRKALILDALAAGWTHQQIKDATGLSRGRIGQIAQTRKAR